MIKELKIPTQKLIYYACILQDYYKLLENNVIIIFYMKPDPGVDEPVPSPICVLGSCYCITGYEYDDLRGVCVPVIDAVGSGKRLSFFNRAT